MLKVLRVLLIVGASVALPETGLAQEATLSGTVSDATGGVLPGVTVTATHMASGNTFLAVTDERGAYRLPVRTGVFQVTAELPGFTTATRSGLPLLVGQQAVLDFQLSPSSVQETVTVTAETPLIDVAGSTVAGNIDPRQMQELPLNGRNWLDLTMLAPGSRTNAVSDAPLAREGIFTEFGSFQINVDGQQVTNNIAGSAFGNPRYSRDAIAEFEFVSNRFDAAQGRSGGVQVNVITKSGTNVPSGSLSGYFRDDRFNAADFIQQRVLPYSNQQLSATFGGPIRRDRTHFFANYEYEREPQTFTHSSPYPAFNIDLTGTRREHKGGLRIDHQFSPQTRVSARANKSSHLTPYDSRYTGGATVHPSTAAFTNKYSDDVFATLTQVLGNRALNEVKVGYAGYHWGTDTYVTWAGGAFPNPSTRNGGSPAIDFRGYTVGTPTNLPQYIGHAIYSLRDDFTTSFNKRGRHDLKVGGEFLYNYTWLDWSQFGNGLIDATAGPPPANIQELFPVWHDAATWNLAAVSPLTIRYRKAIGSFQIDNTRYIYGAWFQDDWAIAERLTLNLGMRYDLDLGQLGEKVQVLPFMSGDRPSDTNNVAPRIGFAYRVDDRTVLRGGWGKYFAQMSNIPAHNPLLMNSTRVPETPNDGRPDFASNPFNGPQPTFEDVERTLCSTERRPGCVRRDITSALMNPDAQVTYSHQASLGVQRQLGETMAIETNYVFTGSRATLVSRNINLSYNPATGANYPFSDINRRPYPDWGVVLNFVEGWSDYHGLETNFTKRFSRRWQASATYTLSGLWAGTPSPVTGFSVAPDLGGEYALSASDQRHRAVFNGIWDIGRGVQLSGLYFFGSGYRFNTSYGGDLRNTGGTAPGRLRPDGTIVPPTNLVGEPLHRVDVRLQRRFPLGGRVGIDGILEVFNLFNHANYGSYVTQESNPNYGRPSFDPNVAYQPRILQLGFRIAF